MQRLKMGGFGVKNWVDSLEISENFIGYESLGYSFDQFLDVDVMFVMSIFIMFSHMQYICKHFNIVSDTVVAWCLLVTFHG